jgi:hypothetical protein
MPRGSEKTRYHALIAWSAAKSAYPPRLSVNADIPDRRLLWKGKPITPKHEPPPPLKKGLFVREAELQFFSDFEDFAEVVNSWLASPYAYAHSNSWWRVQELPRSELLYLGGPDPTYGRTYAVFHNQVRIGEMEIKPGSRRPEGVHGMMSSRRRSILGRRRERFSFPTRGGLCHACRRY